MTRSSRHRSSGATPGAVVCASHCCGTIRPSAATASRGDANPCAFEDGSASSQQPTWAQAARWSPNWSTRALLVRRIGKLGACAWRRPRLPGPAAHQHVDGPRSHLLVSGEAVTTSLTGGLPDIVVGILMHRIAFVHRVSSHSWRRFAKSCVLLAVCHVAAACEM